MKKMCGLFTVGVSVMLIGLLIGIPCTANAAPKGKVVAVCRASMGMRGGDPATNGGSSGTAVIALLHEGLGYKANDGKIYPGLAKSWKIDPNWKHITFHLNEKAKWGDGKPVTALGGEGLLVPKTLSRAAWAGLVK